MKKILKWFENLFQNQNNKALEKFIGRVSSSAEVEEKIRQWEKAQRRNNLSF